MGLLLLGDDNNNVLAPLWTKVQNFTIALSGTNDSVALGTTIDKDLTSLHALGAQDNSTNDDLDQGMFNCVLTDNDNVDANAVSPFTSMTIKGQATSWNPIYVKKVHHQVITITSQTATTTLAVNAKLVNCIPVLNGATTTEGSDDYRAAYVNIKLAGSDDAVEIIATLKAAQTDTLNVSISLIECHPGVLELNQAVAISMGSVDASKTFAVTAMDEQRTLPFWNGHTAGGVGNNMDALFTLLERTDDETITAIRDRGSGSYEICATYATFSGAILKSVEHISDQSFGAGETTDPITLGTPLTGTGLAVIFNMGAICTAAVDWQGDIHQFTSEIGDINTVNHTRTTASGNGLRPSFAIAQG